MAAPTLSSQPKDILKLISRMAGISELAALQATSRNLRQPLKNSRLPDQKLQWNNLFPGQLSDDFDRNEAMIRRFGLATLDLTAGEREALILARASLSSPPSRLTEEERRELIKKWLPRHSAAQAQNLEGWTALREADFRSEVEYKKACEADPREQASLYHLEILTQLYGVNEVLARNLRLMSQNPNLAASEPISLTHLVLLEKNFLEGYLRIFAVDGDRCQTNVYWQLVGSRLNCYNMEEEKALRRQPPSSILLQRMTRRVLPALIQSSPPDLVALSRNLLPLVVALGIQGSSGEIMGRMSLFHPLYAQIYSAAGANFTTVHSNWICLYESAVRGRIFEWHPTVDGAVLAIGVILDRILSQGQLETLRTSPDFELFRELILYERRKPMVQEVITYLREYGILEQLIKD